MKKILSLLFISSMLLVFSPASLSAADKPKKEDILLMKHTILTLWNMGHTSSTNTMNNASLYINTLKFLSRSGQINLNGEFREAYPDRFINIPKKYNLFFNKVLVERTALMVFNGWVDSNSLPSGVFLGSEGYYVDYGNSKIFSQYDDDSYLPSFVAVESIQQLPNGTIILSGKLRRFKQNFSTLEEIPWASAPFMARFSPIEGGWQLTSFVITAEALG